MNENNFYLENCVFSINSHKARVGQRGYFANSMKDLEYFVLTGDSKHYGYLTAKQLKNEFPFVKDNESRGSYEFFYLCETAHLTFATTYETSSGMTIPEETGERYDFDLKCDLCNTIFAVTSRQTAEKVKQEWNYCPNCGAKFSKNKE